MKNYLSLSSVITVLTCVGVVACQSRTTDAQQASVESESVSDKEMCGTVIQKLQSIYLQSVSGNSEDNGDYLLEPQDGATLQVLDDLAQRAGNACITARFVVTTQAVLVTSVANIRETN